MAILTRAQIKLLSPEELVEYSVEMSEIHKKLDEIEQKMAERVEFMEKEFDDKIAEVKLQMKTRFEKVESELVISQKSQCTSKS